jgi:hypothetical protein
MASKKVRFYTLILSVGICKERSLSRENPRFTSSATENYAAVATVTPYMLRHAWEEIECRLHICTEVVPGFKK